MIALWRLHCLSMTSLDKLPKPIAPHRVKLLSRPDHADRDRAPPAAAQPRHPRTGQLPIGWHPRYKSSFNAFTGMGVVTGTSTCSVKLSGSTRSDPSRMHLYGTRRSQASRWRQRIAVRGSDPCCRCDGSFVSPLAVASRGARRSAEADRLLVGLPDLATSASRPPIVGLR